MEHKYVSVICVHFSCLNFTSSMFTKICTYIFQFTDSLLSSMYYLFKDSPARREDFLRVSGNSSKFPLKYVSHRWIENVPVIERALEIWDCLVAYVSAVKAQKICKPNNKSFEVLKEAVEDKLIIPKLYFCKFVAENNKYSFRYSDTVVIPQVQSTRYGLRSLRYEGTRLWNSLPQCIREETNFNQFRSLLSSSCEGSCECSACI
ncbi:Uncharacterised protein at_DN0340 [Pycnogonum litorale]